MQTTRLLTILVTLFMLHNASATEQLYKWREADGSLTFSHSPPDKDSGLDFEKVATGEGIDQGQAGSLQPSTKPTNQVQTAPDNSLSLAATTQRQSTPRKISQCSELKKRVLSLERLLQTDISAQTMDNAVIQMARYQASFNQSCDKTSRH